MSVLALRAAVDLHAEEELRLRLKLYRYRMWIEMLSMIIFLSLLRRFI